MRLKPACHITHHTPLIRYPEISLHEHTQGATKASAVSALSPGGAGTAGPS